MIVDGLYEAYPNDILIHGLVELLESHGLSVDVVKGRDAGPDVFASLTRYPLVVLRVHGGYMAGEEGVVGGLFTGVPWGTRFLDMAREGLAAEGVPVYPPPRGPRVFLALLPRFFEERLVGHFVEGSVVVAGGCYTALDPGLVEALCRRGLGAYIGFEGEVRLDVLDTLLPLIVERVLEAQNLEDLRGLVELHPGLRVYTCGADNNDSTQGS